MKILLVEDDAEKTRLVCNALMEVDGVKMSEIRRCSSVFETKQALSDQHFDLMILDMNLPGRLDRPTNMAGGIEIARLFDIPGSYNYPTYVVALTAYSEGLVRANGEFSNPLWKVIPYAADESDWRDTLKAIVTSLVTHSSPIPSFNDGSTYHTDLGIIVGLENIELQSILALDCNAKQIKLPHDPIRYFKGRLLRDSKEVNFIAAAPPLMGLVNAAVAATKLVRNFRPRYLAMSGICAGIRQRTELADILVADPCFDWGSGKIISNKDDEEDFIPAPYQWRLDSNLRTAAKTLSENQQWLSEIYQKWTSSRPSNIPNIRIDAIASGGSVLQRQKTVDSIIKLHKNLIGIEMEAYSVFTAAALSDEPQPKVIVAKSVCDFGDEDKSDGIQAFAAYTSAKFIEEIALRVMAHEVQDE